MRLVEAEKLSAESMEDAWRTSSVAQLPPGDVMLVTDFDGTLAEIVSEPSDAAGLPGSIRALKTLVPLLARVVVISSRADVELKRLVPVRGVRLIGDRAQRVPTRAERQALNRFNAEAARIVEGSRGVRLEIKPASSAVHFRQSTTSADALMSVLTPLLEATGLEGLPGRRVIEVRPPRSSKGHALEMVLAFTKPNGVICLGDDENDRSVFELMSSLPIPHFSVGVGSTEVAANLFELCDLVVTGPKDAVKFLRLVAEWASNAPDSSLAPLDAPTLPSPTRGEGT